MNFEAAKIKHDQAIRPPERRFPELRIQVDESLFSFLVSCHEYFSLEFPLSDYVKSELSEILFYRIGHRNWKVFYENAKSEGSICGHVFTIGDTIYQCTNCQFDDTCVMCLKCFKASDHAGHDTSFRICENSGGCCDCGDPEAWRAKGTCAIHNIPNETGAEFAEDVIADLRLVIKTIINFALVTIFRTPNSFGDMEVNLIDTSFNNSYSLILWNDETHSYDDVTNILAQTLEISNSEGERYASIVDKIGRSAVYTADNEDPQLNIQQLRSFARRINLIALRTSIRPSRDVFREDIACFLLDFMNNLSLHFSGPQTINGVQFESLSSRVKKIICEEMMRPFEADHFRIANLETPADYFLVSRRFFWREASKITKNTILTSFIVSNQVMKNWIGMRFVKLYKNIYQTYLNDVKRNDDFHNSIISLSVQIFTVPSICQLLVNDHQISREILTIIKATCMSYIGSSIDIKADFFGAIHNALVYNSSRYPPFRPNATDLVQFERLMTDLTYLLSGGCNDLFGISSGNSVSFGLLLEALALLQGMNPCVRETQQHISMEPRNWISYPGISNFANYLIDILAMVYGNERNLKNLTIMVNDTQNRIKEWCISDHYASVVSNGNHGGFHYVGFTSLPKHKVPLKIVGVHEVSLYHPLHWLLSSLLMEISKINQHCSIELNPGSDQMIIEFEQILTEDQFRQSISEYDKFLLLVDYPLQVLVFLTQIQSRLWIRNGESLYRQGSLFNSLLRPCMKQIIFLLQLAAVQMDVDAFLIMYVDRFGFLDYINNPPKELDPKDISQSEFLTTGLITILSENDIALGASFTDLVKKEMIHKLALYENGLSFSKLYSFLDVAEKRERQFHTNDSNYKTFESLLKEIAEFKPPSLSNEQGLFKLKEDYYKEIDAYSWYYGRNERDKIYNILREKFKNSSDTQLELVLPNVPVFDSKNTFFRLYNIIGSRSFCFLLSSTLWRYLRPLIYSDCQLKFTEIGWEHALRLLLIAIDVTKKYPQVKMDFFQNITSVKIQLEIAGFPDRVSCLLDIILGLLSLREVIPELKLHSKRLLYVLGIIEECSMVEVKATLASWHDNNWNFFGIEENSQKMNDGNKSEDKKAKANSRKAAILKQFQADTEKFMTNFAADVEDMNDEWEDMEIDELPENMEEFPDYKEIPISKGSCIICQEDIKNGGKLFGMSCFVQPSSTHKAIDFQDTMSLATCLAPVGDHDAPDDNVPALKFTDESQRAEFYDSFRHSQFRNGARINESGNVLTSCGHLMHDACLKEYVDSLDNRLRNHGSRRPEDIFPFSFLCPLCKTIGNALLPIVWTHTERRVNWNGTVSENSESFGFHSRNELIGNHLKRIQQLISNEFRSMENNSIPGGFETPRSILLENMAKRLNIPNSVLIQTKDCYKRSLWQSLKVLGGFKTDSHLQKEGKIKSATAIWDLYISTICSIEIMSRKEPSTLGEPYPSHNFLRIGLFDTISEKNLNVLSTVGKTVGISTLSSLEECQPSHFALYIADYLAIIMAPVASQRKNPNNMPMLKRDAFTHLVYFTMTVGYHLENPSEDIFVWVYVFAIFEILRTVLSLMEAICLCGPKIATFFDDIKDENISIDDQIMLSTLIDGIDKRLSMNFEKNIKNFDPVKMKSKILTVCMNSLLLYFRKSSLLLYAHFGFLPPGGNHGFGDPKKPRSIKDETASELERLLLYHRSPTLSTMLSSMSLDADIQKFVGGWCEALKLTSVEYWSNIQPKPNFVQEIRLSQPQRFELFNLPVLPEDLLPIVTTVKCLNCKNIPLRPAICLLCGTLVCLNSLCCMSEDHSKGEGNLHLSSCGGEYGIYFSIKGFTILYVGNGLGMRVDPPYLDEYGEADRGLKRGRPMVLDAKKYRIIRNSAARYEIATAICHYVDEQHDLTAWELI